MSRVNQTTGATYTKGQKVLHWLLAVLVLLWLFVSGELVEGAEGAEKGLFLIFHSSGAILILLLTFLRYQLRLSNPVPPLDGLKGWEKILSGWMHIALYIAICLMVLSGLLQGMFFEQPVRLFGLVPITVAYSESFMAPFHQAHQLIATALKVMIAIHVVAGFKHHFQDGLPVLRRMT
ncbi:MAG: cytochrome b/b6 domain-containing protein [Gammaproteobacteria bacterium]|nr:cytochrome b/b6 domain-containing protein [Gammaproteobacteria bacterium]